MGLANKLDSFETSLGLQMTKELFGPCEKVAKVLQHKPITAQATASCIKALLNSLQKLRENFACVFKQAKVDTDEEPTLPRQRRVLKRLQDGDAPKHECQSVEEHYRIQHLQALDSCMKSIRQRLQTTFVQSLVRD